MPAAAPPFRILLAEDDPLFRRSMAIALKGEGYEVEESGDGPAARGKVLAALDAGCPFDLLITDMQMPGSHGIELIDALLAFPRAPGFLAITGFGNKELVVRLMKRGCLEYLDKPFSSGRLVAAVKEAEARIRALRRREEESRSALKRLALAGLGAASILHDLRSPLCAVSGAIDLLEERAEVPRTPLRILKEASRSIEAHVNDFLELASGRGTGLHLAEARVRDMAEQALLAFSGRARIGLDIPEGLRLRVDWFKAVRILENLIANAVEALDGNPAGRIAVAAASAGEGDEAMIHITVSDNGPGISPALEGRLFEPGATTRPGRGGGLGLFGARQLAELHGGGLRRIPGEGGARFLLTLPVHPALARSAADTTPPDADGTSSEARRGAGKEMRS